jgi:hypothetical protein
VCRSAVDAHARTGGATLAGTGLWKLLQREAEQGEFEPDEVASLRELLIEHRDTVVADLMGMPRPTAR